MTTQPQRWYSLGTLFGGFTPEYEAYPPPAKVSPPTYRPLTQEEIQAQLVARADAAFRAAGYKPQGPFPGRSKPWPSICMTCGAPRQPTLHDIVARRMRCMHTRQRSTAIRYGQAGPVRRDDRVHDENDRATSPTGATA
ncbi:hypothetical protein [Streptomyces nogalater]|uniref:Uncharacterized protein n=1 Tax=Streptomyces nogalater TaxID=38314 RepID=A0ABW0W8L4_STRNO